MMLSLRGKPSSALQALDMQVARLTLQPGDAVVISTDRHLNREQADQIRALTNHALPPDVKVIVLSAALAMTVLRQGDSATADPLTPVCLAVDHRVAPAPPPPPPTRSVRYP